MKTAVQERFSLQTNTNLNLSRRAVLSGLAAVAASSLISKTFLPKALGAVAPGRIDVHHHFASPLWISELKANNALNGNRFEIWSPARSLEAMDKSGTSLAMASITGPGIWFGEGFGNAQGTPGAKVNNDAKKLARESNEFGAKMAGDHKGRFGIWASIPIMDVDASLKEIEYSLDTLKCDGICLMTSYGNRWLGDPIFAPVFEELNRRKAIVYTHPVVAPCCRYLVPNIDPGTEYNTDTSRTVISWITSGAAAKFPDVQMIFSHAGGTIPYLIERIIGANEGGGPAGIADLLSKPPAPNSKLYFLRKFFYDTANSTNPVQMQALKRVVSPSQIVFGTDYPYSTMADHVEGLKKCELTESDLRGIDRENFLRIMPKYRG